MSRGGTGAEGLITVVEGKRASAAGLAQGSDEGGEGEGNYNSRVVRLFVVRFLHGRTR